MTMNTIHTWHQDLIQRYIDDGIQESLSLEYKSAGALSKTDNRKTVEITKDVSAMANSSGGLIIYGVQEFNDKSKRHLPECISPIDGTQISKEWLEQIINNIKPRISGVVIHPVELNNSSNQVLYVVEIPQSTTAHQASDWVYYKRYNFQVLPMEDYEIRDVMNRAAAPNASLKISLYRGAIGEDWSSLQYRGLRVIVKNEGEKIINRFKVILKLTRIGWHDDGTMITEEDLFEKKYIEDDPYLKSSFVLNSDDTVDLHITYQPEDVLFPQEEINIGSKIKYAYNLGTVDLDDDKVWNDMAQKSQWTIAWKLYADSMPCKQDVIPVRELPVL